MRAKLEDVATEFVAGNRVRITADVQSCSQDDVVLAFEVSADGANRRTDRFLPAMEREEFEFFFGGFDGSRQIEGCVELLSAEPS